MTFSRSDDLFAQNLSNIGLGYSIAIAICFLIFLSSLLLASYICFHRRRRTPAAVSTDDSFAAAAASGTDEESSPQSLARGLHPSAIAAYPRMVFPGDAATAACAICLGEYVQGEELRVMPECRHVFHVPCVDRWLALNGSCPVCRKSSPAPTPVSTPLSELVPLSQFPGGRRQSS